MSTVALILSKQLNRTVLDKTGLAGDYDFTLDWTPAGNHATTSGQQGADNAPSHESSAPSIFTTLEQQLGLKLESQKVPMEILVIDHAENASEN